MIDDDDEASRAIEINFTSILYFNFILVPWGMLRKATGGGRYEYIEKPTFYFLAHINNLRHAPHTRTTAVLTHHDPPLSFSRRGRDCIVGHCGQPVFGSEERHQFRRGHEGTVKQYTPHKRSPGGSFIFLLYSFVPTASNRNILRFCSVKNASPLTCLRASRGLPHAVPRSESHEASAPAAPSARGINLFLYST